MSESWKSLHPASLLVNLLPRTWNTLRSAWPLLVGLAFGRATGQGVFEVLLLMVFFGLAIGGTVLHFLTLRYRMVDDRLEISSGLVNRQVRVISAERVQNVEMIRNVFHRLSGLVEVRIETASGREAEGLLSALRVSDAQVLVDALTAARRDPPSEEGAPAVEHQVLVHNGPVELLWYGATSTRIGAVALLGGVGFEMFTAWIATIDQSAIVQTSGVVVAFAGSAFVMVILTGAWLGSVITSLVRHHGFRLVVTQRGLAAEQGLVTRRRAELRVDKVQLVTIDEPLIRRWAGFASVSLETAAAGEGDGTQRAEAAVPFADADGVRRILGASMPVSEGDPLATPLTPPHPLALRRARFGGAVRALLLALAAGVWFWPYGLVAILGVPLALFAAKLDYENQGFLVTERLVVARRGFWSRRTALLARGKLQSVVVSQGPLLRRLGLGSVQIRVAGSRIELPLLAFDDARALQSRLVGALHSRVHEDLR